MNYETENLVKNEEVTIFAARSKANLADPAKCKPITQGHPFYFAAKAIAVNDPSGQNKEKIAELKAAMAAAGMWVKAVYTKTRIFNGPGAEEYAGMAKEVGKATPIDAAAVTDFMADLPE